ncbi:MAG TPA: cobyric acid synthase [Actinobacteria bacterium]|nr:cobyric acid synthase [Actinomycetota bacterium]
MGLRELTMNTKFLMIQGTGSQVGKSFIVAGLCRLLKKSGVNVVPFKSQNMALNSYATEEGHEMGRAQAMQAMAAGVKPSSTMNPILLKPASGGQFQVVVLGQSIGNMDPKLYSEKKDSMMRVVRSSLDKLKNEFDLIIIEGAGSPAEINLAEQDIVNMAIARETGSPVVIVADIDRGGAFASICGTLDLLALGDRGRVKGFIINKFRGDTDLLKPGLDFLENKTGLPVFGVVPRIDVVIGDEDALCLEQRKQIIKADVRLAVPRLPHISNTTDFQPFDLLDNVALDFIQGPGQIQKADAIIIPGTKSTIADLTWLRETGLAQEIVELAMSGVPVIGICGGLQILGTRVVDRSAVDGGGERSVEGLGLLPVRTELGESKVVKQVKSVIVEGEKILGTQSIGCRISGYEIHVGVTTCHGPAQIFTRAEDGRPNGWISEELSVAGCYMHGIFDDNAVRTSFLQHLSNKETDQNIVFAQLDLSAEIDKVSDVLEASLNIKGLLEVAGSDWQGRHEEVVR